MADVAAFRRRLLYLVLGRLAFAILLALMPILVYGGRFLVLATPAGRLLSVSVFASIVLSLAYIPVVLRARRGLYWIAFGQIQLDLAMWGIIVLVTGGVNSYFTFLFHLWIVVAAVYLGDRGVIFTLVLSVAVYLIVVLALLLDWLPEIGSLLRVVTSPAIPDLIVALVLDIGSMGLVAMLGWILALQVAHAGASLERTKEIFEDLSRLNEAIVALMPSALVTTDAAGSVRTANPAWIAMTRRLGPDLARRPLREILGDSFEPGAEAPRSGEAEVCAVDGGMLLEYTTAPLRDGSGRVIGSIVHIMDVTEVRLMTQRLGEFEKYRAMGNLAVGLAHEIRNPLGSISGSIELVKENASLEDEDRRLLGIVERETERIGRLVTTLFDLSKPPEPVTTRTDIGNLVAETVEFFSRDRDARGLEIDAVLGDGLAVMADRGQIGQVLLNLLRNAAESSRDSGATVEVVAARDEDGWVAVRVIDSGRGIDPEIADRVFDPYFTTKSYGLGIGLSLCKGIMERHGGTISVAGRPEGGAISTIRLPPVPVPPG